MLIAMSLFISATLSLAADSYSQLYNYHGVKILSPTRGEEVPTNSLDFMIRGVSTDNSTNNCEVSLLLNGITPYVITTAEGQNGTDDYSVWEHKFTSNVRINEGENKISARLQCLDDDGNQINEYHSVNFTGRQLDASLAPVSGQVMGSDATLANASLNKATYEKTENKTDAATLKPDNKSADLNKEQTGRNITSGPVIIPHSATNTTPSSNTTSDAVIIPPRDEQQVSVPPSVTNTTPSSNTTSDAATIPARDEQQQQETTSFTSPYSTIEEASTMKSTIDTNSTSAAADVDNTTSGSVFISPPQEPQQRQQWVDQHYTQFCPPPQASGSASSTASSQTQINLVFQQKNENSEPDDIRPGDIPLVLPTPQVKDQTDLEEEESTVPPSPPSIPSSGNESSSSPSPITKIENNSSPIIKIENNNTKISEGSIASLNATKSCIFNGPTAASYEWKPLITNATTLPPVEIIGELSSPVLRFKAPNVSQDTPLQFELVLSDSQGNTQTEVGQVIVEDVPINPEMGNENNQSKVRIPSDAQSAVEGLRAPSNVRIPDVNVTSSSESKADNSSGGNGTEPIIVKAGVNQIVNEGMAVSLEGNAVGPGVTENLQYEWTQIGGDPQVEFEGSSSSANQITFRAPDVDEDSLLTFRLSVVSTEEEEQAFSDDVTVMIRNIPEPSSDDGEDDDESDEDGNDDDNDDDN